MLYLFFPLLHAKISIAQRCGEMTHIVEIIINFLSSLLQIESSAFNKLILVEVVKMMNNVWYQRKWYIRALKLFCFEYEGSDSKNR